MIIKTLCLKFRELYSRGTVSTRKHRTFDKVLSISIYTNIDLVKLAIVVGIMVALDPRVKPDLLLDGLLHVFNIVKLVVGFDLFVFEGLEEVGLVLEV